MTEPKKNIAELHLPRDVLDRASLRGNEYAWRIDDIPAVIQAAENANLVNVGGQLQFRLPDGGTCECYWIEVDTFKSVPDTRAWNERVTRTAAMALADFEQLKSKYNFLEEGIRDYGKYLIPILEKGGDPADTMWFVWYLLDKDSAVHQSAAK